MVEFNWQRFLDSRRIEFVTKGASVARGNVAIHCPFCGDADQGHHMGVSLRGKGWGCWRSTNHRGRRPHRLIQALIGCGYLEAAAIVGDGDDVLGQSDGLTSMLAGLGPAERAAEPKGGLTYPEEVRPLQDAGMGRMFIDYLTTRLYGRAEAQNLARTYDLRYCVRGAFNRRLIVPVVLPQGLVNWTGRAITSSARLRYRTLSTDPEKAEHDDVPQAVMSIERTLWNMADLLNDAEANTLVVCEGPFDAIRCDWLGYSEGIRATCLFGKNISPEQVELLDILSDYYERRILLLDRDASLDQLMMQSRLEYLGFEFKTVPRGFKDPAEFELADLLGLCRRQRAH